MTWSTFIDHATEHVPRLAKLLGIVSRSDILKSYPAENGEAPLHEAFLER
jgi:hypothetical protein